MNFFSQQYILVASILTIVYSLLFNLVLPQYVTIPGYLVPAFFSVVSLMMIKVLSNPRFEKIVKFSNAFMLTNAVKMFLFLAVFLTVYLCIDREKRIAFAIYFLLTYIIYAVVDTFTLLNVFRNRDDEGNSL